MKQSLDGLAGFVTINAIVLSNKGRTVVFNLS